MLLKAAAIYVYVAMSASEHLCNNEEPLLSMYVLFALYNVTLNFFYAMLGVNKQK